MFWGLLQNPVVKKKTLLKDWAKHLSSWIWFAPSQSLQLAGSPIKIYNLTVEINRK